MAYNLILARTLNENSCAESDVGVTIYNNE
jgi:hypothetical protein